MTADEHSFQFEDRIVAFVDVLGFADLVKKAGSSSEAEAKLAGLIATNQLFEKMVQKWLGPSMQGAFFSDSFALSETPPEHWTIRLIRETGYLCRYLLLQGLACRGGIATGPLFHDGRFVVGPALVKAYELEQSVAVYPRIVLDEASMVHWINEVTESATSQLRSLVKRDRDGQHFLDLFHPAWPGSFIQWTEVEPLYDPMPVDQAEFLRRAREQVERGLAESEGNQRVRMKYEWLAAELHERDGL
jgi:hypothetical protein